MNCQCGTEMMLHYSNHYDSYRDIYWCPDCGRLFTIDEDEEQWLTPSITSQDEGREV